MKKKGMIKRILFVVGVLGLIWFLIPFIGGLILNIGNGAGIILFFFITIYSVKMRQINNLLVKIWKKSIGRIVLIGTVVFAVAAVIIVVSATSCMIQAANKHVSKDSTVVVLGCSVYGERPSLILLERLEAAYAYLNENKNAKCILSGGQGSDESISEAECMYQYLIGLEIDPSRLYKEDKSTSTRENIAFSKLIIEQNNLSPDLAIVTNEFHEYRAAKVAHSLGLDSGAIPAKTAWWLLPTYYVREIFGIVYEWVF